MTFPDSSPAGFLIGRASGVEPALARSGSGTHRRLRVRVLDGQVRRFLRVRYLSVTGLVSCRLGGPRGVSHSIWMARPGLTGNVTLSQRARDTWMVLGPRDIRSECGDIPATVLAPTNSTRTPPPTSERQLAFSSDSSPPATLKPAQPRRAC